MTDRFEKTQEDEIPVNSTDWTDILSGTAPDIRARPHTIFWGTEWKGDKTNVGFDIRALLIKPDLTEIVLGIIEDIEPPKTSTWQVYGFSKKLTTQVDQDGSYTFKLQAKVRNISLTLTCRNRTVWARQQ